MSTPPASQPPRALAVPGPRVLSGRTQTARSVRSRGGHWEPPEGLSPEDVQAIIAAAACERDRLLMRVLWATGARISEVLALRPIDVHRDSLVLPNRKNPSRPTKRVYLPGGQQDLPGELLLWAREQRIADDGWLFPGRFPSRPLSRMQAWSIVRAASERAGVQVLALRDSQHGQRGEPAPIHPHLFRHARVRQIVRTTRNLSLAQRQAGWSRLQMAYLTVGDEEARQLMRAVDD